MSEAASRGAKFLNCLECGYVYPFDKHNVLMFSTPCPMCNAPNQFGPGSENYGMAPKSISVASERRAKIKAARREHGGSTEAYKKEFKSVNVDVIVPPWVPKGIVKQKGKGWSRC